MQFGRKLSIGTAVIAMVLSVNFTSFASVDVDLNYVKELTALQSRMAEYIIEMQGNNLVNTEDGRTVMMNKHGYIQKGWSFDSNGDLYYTPCDSLFSSTESDYNIIRDAEYNSLYFDSTGKFVNPALDTEGKFTDKLAEFARGGVITLASDKECKEFIEVYHLSYNIYSGGLSFRRDYLGDGSVRIRIDDKYIFDYDSARDKIINTFGKLQSQTVGEKVTEATQKVRCIEYDLKYRGCNIDTVLENMSGVCSHYCNIVKVLLQDAGVEVEVVHGSTGVNQSISDMDLTHVWLRCKNEDGRWIYVDPTLESSLYENDYLDINYSLVCNRYIPHPIRYQQ